MIEVHAEEQLCFERMTFDAAQLRLFFLKGHDKKWRFPTEAELRSLRGKIDHRYNEYTTWVAEDVIDWTDKDLTELDDFGNGLFLPVRDIDD